MVKLGGNYNCCRYCMFLRGATTGMTLVNEIVFSVPLSVDLTIRCTGAGHGFF
jgi:hypothetical protein